MKQALAITATSLALILVGCEQEPPQDSPSGEADNPLQAAVADVGRSEDNRARDRYRNPVQTLDFLGIQPEMTVVELWPGGGWYSEVLVPYLAKDGNLYLAHAPADDNRDYAVRQRNEAIDRYGDLPYVSVTAFAKNNLKIAPQGSADMVLTFRNLHNWLAAEYLEQMYEAAWKALKPGGILGVVEHRAKPGTSNRQMRRSGYVTEALAIELAEEAGFVLEAKSEVNANPQDTADHPRGVWTLPPSLRLGEEDRDKYLAIGESDRMTLKFVKPAE